MLGLSDVPIDQALRRVARSRSPVSASGYDRTEESAIRDDGSERHGFLSMLPAGRAQRRLALAAVLISAAVFAIVAPFAEVRLARIEAFIPAYQAAASISDLITAVLLIGQYSIVRSRATRARERIPLYRRHGDRPRAHLSGIGFRDRIAGVGAPDNGLALQLLACGLPACGDRLCCPENE